MSKKKTEERKRNRNMIEVKSVHYGSKRLVDCMKTVIQIHRNRGLNATGGEYGQER